MPEPMTDYLWDRSGERDPELIACNPCSGDFVCNPRNLNGTVRPCSMKPHEVRQRG